MSVIGGQANEMQILLSPEKMKFHGATLGEVLEAIDNANANALMLRDTNQSNHLALMGKLDQMQTQAMQDKLDALREKNSALVAQISNEHQTQALQAYQAQIITPVNAALAALQAEVAGIKCKLPNTVSVPYPQLKTYNPEVFQAAAMGAYAGDVAANAASTVGCGC